MGGLNFRSHQDTIEPHREFGDVAKGNDTWIASYNWEAQDQHLLHGHDAERPPQMPAIMFRHQGPLTPAFVYFHITPQLG
ncbi:hypothetical protein D9M68_874640 [compost metagenome]